MHPLIQKAFDQNNKCLTVHDYMMISNRVYYENTMALGPQGDFITAPEISSLFGDIIGLSLLDAWHAMGSPPVDLIELGPGRGLLMQDILRITRHDPHFHESLCLKFVDIHRAFTFDKPHRVFKSLEEALSPKPTLFVANEFFDALPIHQYIHKDTTKLERFVHLHEGKLSYSFDDDTIMETCPLGLSLINLMASHIHTWGGYGLIIDYGKEGMGSTLQAVKDHKQVHPLSNPGYQDLTAHVDFKALLEALTPWELEKHLETQRSFLVNRGLYVRLQQSPDLKTLKAIERLVGIDAMGLLFKVLWMTKAA